MLFNLPCPQGTFAYDIGTCMARFRMSFIETPSSFSSIKASDHPDQWERRVLSNFEKSGCKSNFEICVPHPIKLNLA